MFVYLLIRSKTILPILGAKKVCPFSEATKSAASLHPNIYLLFYLEQLYYVPAGNIQVLFGHLEKGKNTNLFNF